MLCSFLVRCLRRRLLPKQATPPTKAPATATKAPAAKAAPAPAKAASSALLNPGSLKAKAPDSFKVKFTTTKGDFIVQATKSWAPLGVDRFYNLVKAGFFTDAAFFRVLPGFVAQFGLSAKPENFTRVARRAHRRRSGKT